MGDTDGVVWHEDDSRRSSQRMPLTQLAAGGWLVAHRHSDGGKETSSGRNVRFM